MATARSHTRLRRRDPRAFQRRRRGVPALSARLLGTSGFNRALHHRDPDRLLARLDGTSAVDAALGPVLDLTLVLADLLRRAIDRFPSARREAEDHPPWKVQAVRTDHGTAHTLSAPPGSRVLDVPQECLFCGEVTVYVGSGRCSTCAALGRRYEVVA